jgi:predicted nucleic acid-binding protein
MPSGVAAWFAATPAQSLFLSVLVIGELYKGIAALRRIDARAATSIEDWASGLEMDFGDRVLPVSVEVARTWGRLSVPDPIPIIDGLLAATAIVHGLVLVTRNTRDVVRTGVQILNPFDEPSPET